MNKQILFSAYKSNKRKEKREGDALIYINLVFIDINIC